MRKSVLSAVLFFAVALPPALLGDARYFRGGGKEQIFYTRGDNIIYRYPEGDPLYRIDGNDVRRCGNSRLIYRLDRECLVRVSDGRRLYILRDGKVIRCTDDKVLYRFDGETVRRAADGKAVLRRDGKDPLLTFFMVLMLTDM